MVEQSQLIEEARQKLLERSYYPAVRKLNEEYVLGVFDAYLRGSVSGSEIATIIQCVVIIGTHLKPAGQNLALEEKRKYLFTGGKFPDRLIADLKGLIERLNQDEKASLAEKLLPYCAEGQNNAILVLGLLGSVGESAIPVLIEQMLKWTNNSTKQRCFGDALNGIGNDAAIPLVVQRLQQLGPNDLLKSAMLLDWLGQCGPSITPELLKFLGASSATKSLIDFGPETIPALLAAVERLDVGDGDNPAPYQTRSARNAAANILSAYGKVSAVPVLDAIKTAQGKLRQSLLEMYGSMRPPALNVDGASTLCTIYLSDNKTESHLALQALLAMGADVIPTLVDCLIYSDKDAHAKIRILLMAYDYFGVPFLITALSHFNSTAQANAAALILKITKSDDKAAVNVLSQFLDSDDTQLLLPCLESLAFCVKEGYKLLPSLAERLRERETSIRKMANDQAPQMQARLIDALEASLGEAEIRHGARKFAPRSPVAESLQSDVNAQQPQSDVNAQQVQSDADAQQLQSDADAQQLQSNVNGQQLQYDVKAQQPQSEAKAQQPQSDAKAQQPQSDAKAQQPQSDAKAQQTQYDAKAQQTQYDADTHTLQSDVETQQLPPMPSYSTIKEMLERRFPNGMLIQRIHDLRRNEKGEVEDYIREELGPVKFAAEPLRSSLSAYTAGQPPFIKKHTLLTIRAGREFRAGRPFGSNAGLFSYDGTNLAEIDGKDANLRVGELMRAEELNLARIDPTELSWFFCHTLVPGFMGQHTVAEPKDGSRSADVVAPSLTLTDDGDWLLRFQTFEHSAGCTPREPILFAHTVRISKQFDITYTQDCTPVVLTSGDSGLPAP